MVFEICKVCRKLCARIKVQGLLKDKILRKVVLCVREDFLAFDSTYVEMGWSRCGPQKVETHGESPWGFRSVRSRHKGKRPLMLLIIMRLSKGTANPLKNLCLRRTQTPCKRTSWFGGGDKDRW